MEFCVIFINRTVCVVMQITNFSFFFFFVNTESIRTRFLNLRLPYVVASNNDNYTHARYKSKRMSIITSIAHRVTSISLSDDY